MKRAAQAVTVLLMAMGVAATAPATARAGIHVKLSPDSCVAQPGDTVTVQLRVFQAESEFNAFDAYVLFDPTRLQFVPTAPLSDQIGPLMKRACGSFFHQFTPRPDTLEIHLSMLCPNAFVTGPGVIYQLRFRVLHAVGPTEIACGAHTEFYRAGFFVRPLEAFPMELYAGGFTAVAPSSHVGTAVRLATPWPNPYRGAGPATVQFSLPDRDRVGFAILDPQGRRVAMRDAEYFDSGPHSITWSGLRLAPGHYVVKMTSGAEAGVARNWVVVR